VSPQQPVRSRAKRALTGLWLALVLLQALVHRPAGGASGRDPQAGPWLPHERHSPRQPSQGPPLVLLHGLPGTRGNFSALGQALAARGVESLAFDLPGFGAARGDRRGRGMHAHARAVLEALDALGVERFHALGWSQGGGVALHLAEAARERVASVTLVASIGLQQGEGSGSYGFEHAKYAAGLGGVWALRHLAPHFGAFDGLAAARETLLAFWHSDQRPLAGMLDRLRAPLLLLHGRHDFLVPLWVAEAAHARVPDSRLVVLDASHFLPLGGSFGQAERVAAELAPFLARHAAPGSVEPRSALIEPEAGRRWLPLPFALQRLAPWWLWFSVLALAAWRWPVRAAAAAGILAALAQLDFGLTGLAVLLGLCGRAAGAGRPRRGGLRAAGWGLCAFFGAFFALLAARAWLA
jgi:pimeloyl-ACP methyl ester carboxylesterase